jgi:hypothetical protein
VTAEEREGEDNVDKGRRSAYLSELKLEEKAKLAQS